MINRNLVLELDALGEEIVADVHELVRAGRARGVSADTLCAALIATVLGRDVILLVKRGDVIAVNAPDTITEAEAQSYAHALMARPTMRLASPPAEAC